MASWIRFPSAVHEAFNGGLDPEGDCPIWGAFFFDQAPYGAQYWIDVCERYERNGNVLDPEARELLEIELARAAKAEGRSHD